MAGSVHLADRTSGQLQGRASRPPSEASNWASCPAHTGRSYGLLCPALEGARPGWKDSQLKREHRTVSDP